MAKETDIIYPHGYPEVKPDTIQKALDILKLVFTDEQKAELINKGKNNLIEFHFSLGLWIRNNFGLWEPNSALLEDLKQGSSFFHPDSASRILLEFLIDDLLEGSHHERFF